MPAPLGNTNNTKWKTSEERKAACERVCEHIMSGLSRDCFPDADWDTVERYIKEYPVDFPPEKIENAMRINRLFWEKTGVEGTLGKIQGFNATSYIFNMVNRFKEDWKNRNDTNIGGQKDNPVEIDQTMRIELVEVKK